MKSFTSLVLVASATFTAAQLTFNTNNNTYTCAIPNAAYCAGQSGTNIIVRCTGTVGQPGNCDDNLAGEPPVGVNYSPCYQSSDTAGDAACSKNGIVYGGSGNANGTFPIPSSTSSVASSSSATPIVSYTTVVTLGTTITVPCSSGTPVFSSSIVAPTTVISTKTAPTGAVGPTGGSGGASGNGTAPTSSQASSKGSATATPVGPTTSSPAQFTGAAVANKVGAALAAGGLFVAYFL